MDKNEIASAGKLYADVCSIIDKGRERANAVREQIIETYWHIGRRIVEEEQQGEEHAEYGEQIIDNLSAQLSRQYGKGFGARYLRSFRKSYLTFRDFEIWKSRFPNLSWTHIFKTLRVSDKTYLPSEEQLRTEIEQQKQLFMLQHEHINKEDKL